jgi:hypothetical protein
MDPYFMTDVAIKAQQWEIAKGHLRALVAMQGSYQSRQDDGRTRRWQDLERAVDDFIVKVEDEGWHE